MLKNCTIAGSIHVSVRSHNPPAGSSCFVDKRHEFAAEVRFNQSVSIRQMSHLVSNNQLHFRTFQGLVLLWGLVPPFSGLVPPPRGLKPP